MKNQNTRNNSNKSTVWILLVVVMLGEVYFYNPNASPFLLQHANEQPKRYTASSRAAPDPVAIRDGLRLSPPATTPNTFQVDPVVAQIYHEIDSMPDVERCQKYGFTYNATLSRKRRIFFGALVADESEALLRMHAAEAYDIYHVVSLVESNTTFMNTDRESLRWVTPGTGLHTLATGGIFGPNTTVAIDEWFDDAPNVRGMKRETIMRETIVQRWIEQGMRPDDIAIIGDLDEVFFRDFLRAAQVCQIPDFSDDKAGDCERPKLVAKTVQYEGMPSCISEKRWFHPDMMLGRCVEGVGDPTGRIMAVRKYKRRHGTRLEGYGRPDGNYLPEIRSLGRYPLWSTQDFRNIEGTSRTQLSESVVMAFHFHNFFNDFATLRHKYVTFGHAKKLSQALLQLSFLDNDMDLLVRCVHNISNNDARVVGYLRDTEYDGTKPIFFRNLTYVREREQSVKNMLAEDETVYGSAYLDDGLDNATMKNQTNL